MYEKKKKAVVPRLRFPEFLDAGEWAVKRLGDVGSVSMCKRVMKAQTSASGDVPFYKIGTFGKKPDAYISKKLYHEFKLAYPYPKNGDILISAAGTIGRTVVYDGIPAYFQDSNIVWIANNERLVINHFLRFYYEVVEWCTDDNTIARLYNETLRSIKIAVPSLSEQQKIADCLASLDDLIRAGEAQLVALKDHKKGLMQQLFPREGETTPRLRFPEFRDAGEWEVKRLEGVAEFLDNMRRPISRFKRKQGTYPYYGASGAIDHIDEYIFDERLLLIGEDGAKWGPFEKTAFIVEGKYWVNNHAHVLRPVASNDVLLENYLNATDVSVYVTGFAPPKLTLDNLKSIRIPISPVQEEQQKIADCLTSLDDLIRAGEAQLVALKDHKKGLMQQLFPQEVG